MANVYTNGSTGNKGIERRKFNRRNVVDRRKDIRWEPDKTSRRQATGRRVADQLGVNGNKR